MNLKILSGIYFLMFVFAGLGFLLFPNGTIYLFNYIGSTVGFASLPYIHNFFYLALALGYMFVVSMISWLVYKDTETYYQLFIVLIGGKTMSSLFSLLYFFIHIHALIYITNFIVDGALALVGFYYYKRYIA